jgi:transposase-like protein
MAQHRLPCFPEGITPITPWLAFRVEGQRVVYFSGDLPVFLHDREDLATFRMITAQFCINGSTKQAEIARVFGIPLITVKRAVKRYRQEGPKGFYAARTPRGPSVLTPTVLSEAQDLLDEGRNTREVAGQLGIKPDTLYKAVRAGRLRPCAKKKTTIWS